MIYLALFFLWFDISNGANITLKTPPTNAEIQKINNRTIPEIKSKSARTLSNQVSSNSGESHTVESGETVIGIARKYGISYKEILIANNLEENSNLLVGKKLKIPNKGESISASNEVKTPTVSTSATKQIHIVQSGETLFSIARDNGITVAQILAYNNLDISYRVKVGEKIKITQTEDTASQNAPKTREKQSVDKKTNTKKLNCKLNFGWPLYSTKVLYGYGDKLPNGTKLDGVMIQGEIGKSIVASQSGIVAYAGNDVREYGNLMIIKHKDNWMTIYGNIDTFKKTVGQKVSKGDLIATVGQTGELRTPSLYFSIRNVKTPYNPELCI